MECADVHKFVLAAFVLSCSLALAREPGNGDMAGMEMSHTSSPGQKQSQDRPDMSDMPGMRGDGSAFAMHSMETHSMDMGPHMKRTSVRPVKPGDQGRADDVVQAARTVAEKYSDYKVRWLTDSRSS
jgi:hypothetical protein